MNATSAETRRLGLALCLALALHAVLILPDFDWPAPAAVDVRPLELLLVRSGAGESDARPDPQRPAQPARSRSATPSTRARRPAPSPQPAMPSPQPAPRETQPAAPVTRSEVRPAESEPAAVTAARTATPSADELRQSGLDMAATLGQALGQVADDGVRRKYVRAGSADWKYAGYINGWVTKIERVGRMNYPQKALRAGLSGELLMSVGIAADGSLESIELRRSSGYPILDEAAKRIVRLCAPYAPLPRAIAAETDVLYITRNWKFLPHGGLQ